MVDQNKRRNEKMPDFDKLSDRIIAEPTDSPSLVMKTNLDPKDVTEGNPYFEKENQPNDETFKKFFDEK